MQLVRREPPATRSGLLKVGAHTARLGCSGGRVARLFMHSVHKHWVGRRHSVPRLDCTQCTDRCPKQQQPVATSLQPAVISIGWISIGCKICSCMALNSIESFLNITRDTFLYTIRFYKLDGVAIPFSDYPLLSRLV